MRKVIGIGETIMDIIFKDGQPTAAVPGGSVFNGIISLGRLGVNVAIISETGNDRVGNMIIEFMKENGVDSSGVAQYQNGVSAISLAWLNEKNDAEYMFYKDYPAARLEVNWPEIHPDDIVMMGSYFVLNPVLRPKVKEFLDYARENGALIYYDFNLNILTLYVEVWKISTTFLASVSQKGYISERLSSIAKISSVLTLEATSSL